MKTWVLIVMTFSPTWSKPVSVAEVGGFKSQASCEQTIKSMPIKSSAGFWSVHPHRLSYICMERTESK